MGRDTVVWDEVSNTSDNDKRYKRVCANELEKTLFYHCFGYRENAPSYCGSSEKLSSLLRVREMLPLLLRVRGNASPYPLRVLLLLQEFGGCYVYFVDIT